MSINCKKLNDFIIKKANTLTDLYDAVVELDIRTIEFIVKNRLGYELQKNRISANERIDLKYVIDGLESSFSRSNINVKMGW